MIDNQNFGKQNAMKIWKKKTKKKEKMQKKKQ